MGVVSPTKNGQESPRRVGVALPDRKVQLRNPSEENETSIFANELPPIPILALRDKKESVLLDRMGAFQCSPLTDLVSENNSP
ncbi:MAG: hypothetical protein ACI9OO_001538 [Bacteroidia bacterium]